MMGESSGTQTNEDRRGFLTRLPTLGMAGGLLAGYGSFFGMAASYLYPAGNAKKTWLLATHVDNVTVGNAFAFQSPAGEQVVIARLSSGQKQEDFIALSSICPHLGCRVHWESQNDRFFCPCHNGTFAPDGAPTGGPPKTANQALIRYPLAVRGNLLFIEVELTRLT
ncbi:MAG: Rieske (2Fe-2S) protein [Pirellulales bacterium]|nr:Rieske (2Fe-2S) protein [Pirellulales bacterium]